jgi:signal transduction histidine kinase/ligand-binding sensor domain-containing protein
MSRRSFSALLQGLPGLLLVFWAMVALLTPGTPLAKAFPFTLPELEKVGDAKTIPEVITSLAQDTRGLIWVGTQQGLVRLDGYRYRKFTHSAGNPASLAGDYVYALCASKDGRLWVGTHSDGLSVFDPATEQFQHFAHNDKLPGSLSAGRISALLEDAGGGIWVATNQGLDYLPRNANQFIHHRHQPGKPNSLLDDKVRSLLLDKSGRLWVGSVSGLQRLAANGIDFETVDGFNGKAIQSLFQAQDGKLWVGTGAHGAAWLEPGHNARFGRPHWLPLDPGSSSALKHGWINGIAQVEANQIWLASNGGGIHIVAASDGRVLQHLRHIPALANSLAGDAVRPLLLDRSGLLWIGTWGAGLQWFNGNNHMIRILRHHPSLAQGLSHPDVGSILELANGQILVGTNGNGIDIFDRHLGLVGGHRAGLAGNLPDASIRALIQSADGTLWAGTKQAGVVRLPPQSRTWLAVPGLPNQQVTRFLSGRDGSLWVATASGAARWQPGQENSSAPPRFEAVPQENGKPMQNGVNTLAEDGQGRIWAGTNNGLWVMEPGAKGWRGIHPEPARADSLISDYISSVLIDRRGKLWLSTNKGLERLRSWDGKVARFERPALRFDQDLGGNLLEDQAGRIWTDSAIIDPITLQVQHLSNADGMNIGPKWDGAYTRTRDGLLLYGGSQGLAIIDPGQLQASAYTPPVVVTELKINGTTAPPGVLAQAPNTPNTPGKAAPALAAALAAALTLNTEQRNFSLEFAALDYVNPNQYRYQYRLQGEHSNWINADAEHRSAAYGNLSPGHYTLQIRASKRNGPWSLQPLQIGVQVLPAFWQTWWFMLLALLAGTGAVYGIHRWRTRRLKMLIAARTADILKLSKIGQELTSTLDTEQAFRRVHRQVSARLDAHVFLIGLVDPQGEQIMFVYNIENGQRQPNINLSFHEPDRPALWCVRERRELIAANQTELLNYVPVILTPKVGEAMETVVYLPLLLEQSVIGCLSVQSLRPHAYDKDQLEFLRVLASYTAIALSNSSAHGELSKAHADLAAAHRQLQETEQQMILQEKMAGLGTLTAGVAHEINNPTNFVHVAAQIQRTEIAQFQAFVKALMEEGEAPEVISAFEQRFKKLDDNVMIMLSGTERIKGIVNDLRAFTRLDDADKKSVRLSECLHSTLNLVRTSWLEKVEFITDFSVDPELECWPALLNQVFMNLLVNGCQAIVEKQARDQSPLPGKLWLRLKLAADGAHIEVIFEDSGIGIEPAVQARIMEPFYTTKEVGSGTGLGLSIAFGIVQKHGGSLTFDSVAGQGSRFTVSLPLIPQAD